MKLGLEIAALEHVGARMADGTANLMRLNSVSCQKATRGRFCVALMSFSSPGFGGVQCVRCCLFWKRSIIDENEMSTSDVFLIQKSLLQGSWDPRVSGKTSPAGDIAKLVVDGDFRTVLTSPAAKKLFHPTTDDFKRPFEQIFNFSAPLDPDPICGELLRLCIAIACLHAFVQANWTGPELNIKPLEILTIGTSNSITEQIIDSKSITELAYNGEPAYHLATFPAFLRLSQLLLASPYSHLETIPWWKLRATLLHQQTLDEPVAHIPDFQHQMDSLASKLANEPNLCGRMYLETGLLHHLFSQDKSAAEYFVKAARATGLEYELTGALGKRTKFQESELSQLVLLAESHLDDDSQKDDAPVLEQEKADVRENNTTSKSNIPETLALNDDTLLEETKFTSFRPAAADSRLSHIDPSAQPPLHSLDQCILLSLCLNVKNTSPSHGLTTEQMAPYVARVISHPCNWSVHTMALLLRSRLESSRTRTVERSTFQLQALIGQMPTSDSTLSERLTYFHSITLPSRWEMEKELAARFLSLGVIKSALEIFERLEMWEEVVKCWSALERPDKGITILRDLLEGRKAEADAVISRGKATSALRKEIEDTTREAKLWCLLGDIEPEKASEHYKRAWLISKETSGRAMRSLGGYYFARANYPEAISSLKRAVSINPLLSRSWFILGCACMRIEQWEDAKNAFSRCVAIDEEDGESWSNLASMYLRMGELKKSNSSDESDQTETREDEAISTSVPFSNKLLAFRALKEGLRFSYENWRMWYNYMIVAMDVGELQEACRALGRVVEQTSGKLGAQSVDEDVLERLVDAVTRVSPNPDDSQKERSAQTDVTNPNEGHGLFRNVSNLFERIILPRMSSPRIFRAYARLLTWQSKWEEALKANLDSYRCSSAGTMEKGETDVAKWREAVTEVGDIVDILTNFGPRVEGYNWRLQGRSIVRTFIGRTRDFEDEPEWARLTELQDDLRKEDD